MKTRTTTNVSMARTLLVKHPKDAVILEVTKDDLIKDAIASLEWLLGAGRKDRWKIAVVAGRKGTK